MASFRADRRHKRLIHKVFYLFGIRSFDLGNLGNNQLFRFVEHSLFAVGEILVVAEEKERFQNIRHFKDAARPHFFRILLESPFPVGAGAKLAAFQSRE